MAMIDDFSSGPTALDLPSGPASLTNSQAGTMLGGGRLTYLRIASDPRHEPAHLDTGSGSLDVSLGAEQFSRIEVHYGIKPDANGNPVWASLVDSGSGDFASMGSVIRTNVKSSSSLLGYLDCIAVAFTPPGYVEASARLDDPRDPSTPSQVDFRFAGTDASNGQFAGASPPDFSQVSYLIFIFHAWGDFVIDSFEIV